MQSKENTFLFFSIVIPAHNEEAYIAETLEHLVRLDYPKNRYEVLVIENGSTDGTYEKARMFEKEHIHVWSTTGKGVSAAKNSGWGKANPKSDWVIFLDADTLLKENFLHSLNDFLLKSTRAYAVGTTEVQPLSSHLAAKFWFAFYNLGHKLTKTSFALQIIKRTLFEKVSFPVELTMGEDLKLIDDARAYGEFFYFPTTEVYTSVRRFEQEGWIKVFLHWNFVALLPARIQKHFTYKVVR